MRYKDPNTKTGPVYVHVADLESRVNVIADASPFWEDSRSSRAVDELAELVGVGLSTAWRPARFKRTRVLLGRLLQNVAR